MIAASRIRTALTLPAAALLIGVFLSGCSKRSEAAKERLELVEKVGSPREVCEAARQVANAYLDEGNEAEYRISHVSASIKCQAAELRDLDHYSR